MRPNIYLFAFINRLGILRRFKKHYFFIFYECEYTIKWSEYRIYRNYGIKKIIGSLR